MPSYQVQPGDTLYDIAEKTTGDGNRWREIYDNNQETVGSDPGLIRPGQVLAIPYNDPVASQNTGRPDDNMTVPQRYVQPPPNPSFGPAVSPYADQGSGNAGFPGITPQSPQKERVQPPAATAPATLAGALPAGNASGPGYKFAKNQYQPSAMRNEQYPYSPNYNGPSGQQQGPQRPGQRTTQVPPYRQAPLNQLAPSEAAKYGVTITPPIQQGINAWQQSKPPMQYEQQSPYAQQAPRPSGPVERQGGPIGAETRGTVTWPAPPRAAQPQQQGVSPAAYGGRFTDSQGNFRPPTVGSYMGKPQPAYQPPPPQQGAAPSGGAWQGGMPPSFMGQARWQTETPRAVVVIANDGSQMVYDTQTGQWRQIPAR